MLPASVVLLLLTVLFYAWRLGGDPSALLYRPGSQYSDLTVTFWPNIAYIQQSLRTYGELPLWRTLIFSGSPFDADPQSGLWYLPNVVFLLLPAAEGFNLLFVLHGVAAGMGMWVWSRATGTSTGSALLSAVAYAFSPKIFAHLGFGHIGLVYASAYVPWVLWAAYRMGNGQWRCAGVLGLALGWQAIAHPQLAFYTGLAAGGYALAAGWAKTHDTRQVRALRVALLGLTLGAALTVLVSAVQLVPMLRMASLTARASVDLAESAVSSIPPRYLWGLLLADHGGFMDYMLYVGIPVVVLAVLALPRRQARGWWAFVVVALLYSLGTSTPLHSWILRLLPALSWLRAPSRVWFVSAAALALLAGWGADRLLIGLGERTRLAINRAGLILGALALLLVLGYAIAFGNPPANLVALGAVAPVTALVCGLAAGRRLPHPWAVAALVVVVLVDLVIVDATLVEGQPQEALFADGRLAAYLSRQMGGEPFRVYSPSYSVPRHLGAYYGVETADGVDPFYLEHYAAFMEVASGVRRRGYGETVPTLDGEGPISSVNREAVPRPALLGLLNVRYVAAEFPLQADGLHQAAHFGSTYVYENAYALPRAFVVGHVQPVEDFEAALKWVQTHDVVRSAAVEGGKPLNSGDVEAEIAWKMRSPDRLVLEVALARPGFLVLSQVWYDGWQAEVDGEPAPVWRVDGVLSGTYLDAGEHTVLFAYRPRWASLLGGASALTWGLLSLGLVGWAGRRVHGSP